jgi:actin-like ATPase involved in cell morphogenesis
VVSKDERKHIRYQVHWKVEVSVGTWTDVLTVTTSSVSRGGLFVCTTQPGAKLGAEVSVSLTLPDENTVNLVGEIVRVVEADAGKGPPGFALRFDTDKASDLVLLEAMASAYGTPEDGEAGNREIRARVIAEATVTEESAVKAGPSPTEDELPEVTPPEVTPPDIDELARGASSRPTIDAHDVSVSSKPTLDAAAAVKQAAELTAYDGDGESEAGVLVNTEDSAAEEFPEPISPIPAATYDVERQIQQALRQGPPIDKPAPAKEEEEAPAEAEADADADADLPPLMTLLSLDRTPPLKSRPTGSITEAMIRKQTDNGKLDGKVGRSESSKLTIEAATAKAASEDLLDLSDLFDEEPASSLPASTLPLLDESDAEVKTRTGVGPEPAPEPEEPEQPEARSEKKQPAPVGIHITSEAKRAFGIDFGTTYCSICLAHGDDLVMLEDDEGNNLIPTVVSYPEHGQPIVGWAAREKVATHPSTTFVSPKRLIGRDYDDPKIQPYLGATPVWMGRGPHGQIVAEIYGHPISMVQVCADILRHVAEIGRKRTGLDVSQVELAAPVGFEEPQRQAIVRAAQMAGMVVVGVTDEPVAAAVAYGATTDKDGSVAVFDFGGGTFDFTLLEARGDHYEVLAEAGDAWLGGDDLDLAMANFAAEEFEKKHKVDLRKRQVEWQRLIFLCEEAKRRLSSEEQVSIHGSGMLLSLKGAIDLKMDFDRELFEALCGELIDRSIETMETSFLLCDTQPDQVEQVVMTGGVSRIPLVKQKVEAFFGREIEPMISPEQAIAMGTARVAYKQVGLDKD